MMSLSSAIEKTGSAPPYEGLLSNWDQKRRGGGKTQPRLHSSGRGGREEGAQRTVHTLRRWAFTPCWWISDWSLSLSPCLSVSLCQVSGEPLGVTQKMEQGEGRGPAAPLRKGLGPRPPGPSAMAEKLWSCCRLWRGSVPSHHPPCAWC